MQGRVEMGPPPVATLTFRAAQRLLELVLVGRLLPFHTPVEAIISTASQWQAPHERGVQLGYLSEKYSEKYPMTRVALSGASACWRSTHQPERWVLSRQR